MAQRRELGKEAPKPWSIGIQNSIMDKFNGIVSNLGVENGGIFRSVAIKTFIVIFLGLEEEYPEYVNAEIKQIMKERLGLK